MKRVLWLLCLLCIAATAGAVEFVFVKGDKIELAKDTPLYFKKDLLRTGHSGERFTVIESRPDEHRVYLSSTDADGKEIALEVEEGALLLRTEGFVQPNPNAFSYAGIYLANPRVVHIFEGQVTLENPVTPGGKSLTTKVPLQFVPQALLRRYAMLQEPAAPPATPPALAFSPLLPSLAGPKPLSVPQIPPAVPASGTGSYNFTYQGTQFLNPRLISRSDRLALVDHDMTPGRANVGTAVPLEAVPAGLLKLYGMPDTKPSLPANAQILVDFAFSKKPDGSPVASVRTGKTYVAFSGREGIRDIALGAEPAFAVLEMKRWGNLDGLLGVSRNRIPVVCDVRFHVDTPGDLGFVYLNLEYGADPGAEIDCMLVVNPPQGADAGATVAFFEKKIALQPTCRSTTTLTFDLSSANQRGISGGTGFKIGLTIAPDRPEAANSVRLMAVSVGVPRAR